MAGEGPKGKGEEGSNAAAGEEASMNAERQITYNKILDFDPQQLSYSPAADAAPLDISAGARDLIRALMQPEPQDRLAVDQALAHPWLTPDAKAQ